MLMVCALDHYLSRYLEGSQMRVIDARNVNDAISKGLHLLNEIGSPRPSRAGNVIVSPVPVTIVYQNPVERVLFWPARDANLFFHVMEGIWMLAGRNDVAFLDRFVRDFGSRFSDDGTTVHGAYGHRWRRWPTLAGGEYKDQLARVEGYLRKFPDGRRAVLTMWDPDRDLYVGEVLRDVPCNQQVMFSVGLGKRDEPNRLNMMVTCRSGDAIWGIAGANACHFSMLHEYLAAKLGLVQGTFTHVINNFHAYEALYAKLRTAQADELLGAPVDPYAAGEVQPYPMVQDPETWDMDLALFLEDPTSNGFRNRWFSRVAKPLWWAHEAWRRKDWDTAFACVEQCLAVDWSRAARQWLERRRAKK